MLRNKNQAATLTIVFFLQLQVSNAKESFFMAEKNQHVKIELENLSSYLRIEFVHDDNLIVTNWYHSRYYPGYNYTYKKSKGFFEILNFTPDKAGAYTFDFSIPEPDGIQASHVKNTVWVLFADVSCGLDFQEGLLLKSDCSKVPRDKVTGWCRMKLSHETKHNFSIKWKTLNGQRGNMTMTYTDKKEIEAREDDVPLENGDGFECYTSTLKCFTTFKPERIIYARNKTAREMTSYRISPMTQDNKQTVECRAKTSSSINCSYEWHHKEGDIMNMYPGATLQKEDLKTNGIYECFARCAVKDYSSDNCVLLSDRVHLQSQAKDDYAPLTLSMSHLVIFLIFIVVILVIQKLLNLPLFSFFKRMNSGKPELINEKPVSEEDEEAPLITSSSNDNSIQTQVTYSSEEKKERDLPLGRRDENVDSYNTPSRTSSKTKIPESLNTSLSNRSKSSSVKKKLVVSNELKPSNANRLLDFSKHHEKNV